MRLKFLELPSDERRLYIEQAAARRNVPEVMLEKVFWVSWVLAALFESRFGDVLVFKGGTSLSKVFAVIDRFSEDIDLSLSPAFLGLDDAAPPSRTQADLWMKKAEAACAAAVNDQLRPALEKTAVEVLGNRSEGWFQFAIDEASNSPVLLFHYPTTQPTGFAYLKRTVKLELGSLTDQQPTERHTVRPWIADVLEEAFDDWRCHVVALDVHRTFWEKATILHSEHHRPADKPTPDRFSRHYADTVALAKD
ncbi:MAG: nucleotidyl transferase AbiEii/AbiGii toxin family protein, partial [Dongiaceae bacterium]